VSHLWHHLLETEEAVSTPRIVQIESLGLAMDQCLISREEAVASLVEWSEGGLTELGAADLLGDWRGARARYAAAFEGLRS
jgi:hypothetical protein